MREFTTAVEAVEGQGDTLGKEITVKVDGREITFLPPTEGQLAMVLATDIGTLPQRISTAINFFFGIIKDLRDVDHFKSRLFDRSDNFGASTITSIIEELVEEWTANPTQSLPDSTESPQPAGARSTAKRQRKG